MMNPNFPMKQQNYYFPSLGVYKNIFCSKNKSINRKVEPETRKQNALSSLFLIRKKLKFSHYEHQLFFLQINLKAKINYISQTFIRSHRISSLHIVSNVSN